MPASGWLGVAHAVDTERKMTEPEQVQLRRDHAARSGPHDLQLDHRCVAHQEVRHHLRIIEPRLAKRWRVRDDEQRTVLKAQGVPITLERGLEIRDTDCDVGERKDGHDDVLQIEWRELKTGRLCGEQFILAATTAPTLHRRERVCALHAGCSSHSIGMGNPSVFTLPPLDPILTTDLRTRRREPVSERCHPLAPSIGAVYFGRGRGSRPEAHTRARGMRA